MATSKGTSDVVIDKNSTAKINVVILVSVLAGLVGATVWLNDIKHSVSAVKHSVSDNTKILEEVKAELAKNGGTGTKNATDIARLQEQVRNQTERIKALEGK